MPQPLITLSFDGGKSVYAFQPGPSALKVLATIALAMLLSLALAVVQLVTMAQSFLNFLLTSPGPVLVRGLAFILAVALTWATITYLQVRLASDRKEADHA